MAVKRVLVENKEKKQLVVQTNMVPTGYKVVKEYKEENKEQSKKENKPVS